MSSEMSREDRPHGRYYAEYVRVTGANREIQLQEVLDAKVGKEWQLVGVAGGLQGEVSSSFGTSRGLALAGAATGNVAAPLINHRRPPLLRLPFTAVGFVF